MIVRCAWCGKQIIDSHECAEKRAALLDAAALGELPTVSEIIGAAASAQRDEAGDDER